MFDVLKLLGHERERVLAGLQRAKAPVRVAAVDHSTTTLVLERGAIVLVDSGLGLVDAVVYRGDRPHDPHRHLVPLPYGLCWDIDEAQVCERLGKPFFRDLVALASDEPAVHVWRADCHEVCCTFSPATGGLIAVTVCPAPPEAAQMH